MDLDQLVEKEREFCESIEMEKNEHGVYVYVSQNGASRISLDFILHEYKEWLLENNLIKLI